MRWIRNKLSAKWRSVDCNELGPYVNVCSPFGLWPLDRDDFILRIRWSICTFCMIIMVFQAIYDSYLNCINVENSGDNLYSITFGVISLSKMIYYYNYRDLLRNNVEAAMDDWSSEYSKNFGPKMRYYRTKYTQVTKYLFMVGSSAAFMWSTKVLFIDPDVTITVKSAKDSEFSNTTTQLKRRFLLPVACTFNEVSQSIFWTIVITQIIMFVIVAAVIICGDAFFIAIACHLCAQLEILKIKFATFPNFKSEKKIREKFNILVARHTHLLKLAKQLENAFSMIMFTQIMLNVVVWNTAGFNFLVLIKKNEMLSAATNAMVMVFIMLQTFVNCYIGDWLTSQGEDLAQAVYHCRWYLMPTSVSKNVTFIMTRTRHPIGLTAGHFLKMTLSTFTATVKTAVSYLSVLRIIIKDI